MASLERNRVTACVRDGGSMVVKEQSSVESARSDEDFCGAHRGNGRAAAGGP